MNRFVQIVTVMVTTILLSCGNAAADQEKGIIAVKSTHNVEKTTKRLETLIRQRGFTLFAQVDHAAGAAAVGSSLRATRLLIFGNPKAGTPLMQCSQSIAIDLPLKALIWTDQSGQVWLGYNDPQYLQERHQITGCKQELANMSKVLDALAQAATR